MPPTNRIQFRSTHIDLVPVLRGTHSARSRTFRRMVTPSGLPAWLAVYLHTYSGTPLISRDLLLSSWGAVCRASSRPVPSSCEILAGSALSFLFLAQ